MEINQAIITIYNSEMQCSIAILIRFIHISSILNQPICQYLIPYIQITQKN